MRGMESTSQPSINDEQHIELLLERPSKLLDIETERSSAVLNTPCVENSMRNNLVPFVLLRSIIIESYLRDRWRLELDILDCKSLGDALAGNLSLPAGEDANFQREQPLERNLAEYETRKRSILPVFANGKIEHALPDTGVHGNVMTEEFARSLGVTVDRDPMKQYNFENAVSTPFVSLGLASLDISFPGHVSRHWKCDFAIVEKCGVPMVLGKAFLDEAEVFTKLRHQMIKAALTITRSLNGQFKKVWRLMLMESSRQKMSCYVGGELAHVDPDSGADIDLVSLDYVNMRNWRITAMPLDEGFIVLSNGDVLKLTAYVNAELTIRGRSTMNCFYVLEGLQSKVILGDETIEKFDIFESDHGLVDVNVISKNKAFCMIQWVERYDQMDKQVDELLKGPDHERLQTKLMWFLYRPKTPRTAKEDLVLRLRHRLDSLDTIEADYEERAGSSLATLNGQALIKAESDNRKRREKHSRLRARILLRIAQLEAPCIEC